VAISGTYNYAPTLGELTLYAFNLCGIRPAELVQQHMASAVTAANLMQSRWATRGVNLWQVAPFTVPFVQGTATYAVPANVIVILDLYISTGSGVTETDRYILPISRTEYATYANKQNQGVSTTYWFDRLLSGNITFWPVPDGTYQTFTYYAVQQLQDATFGSGGQPDVQFYFLEAYADGLAYRLSKMWAPDKSQMLKMEAKESFDDATTQNVETNSVFFSPTLSSYWRT
jgi:hypothetical protein